MRAYMKSAMPFLGVQKPAREEIARAVFAAHSLDGFDAWRDTVLNMWREATYREERYLAIRLALATGEAHDNRLAGKTAISLEVGNNAAGSPWL